MPGAYCQFCEQRCFVVRELRDGTRLHLATCPEGMAHDQTSAGETARTARNPYAEED